jgi:hypothetical protein
MEAWLPHAHQTPGQKSDRHPQQRAKHAPRTAFFGTVANATMDPNT